MHSRQFDVQKVALIYNIKTKNTTCTVSFKSDGTCGVNAISKTPAGNIEEELAIKSYGDSRQRPAFNDARILASHYRRPLVNFTVINHDTGDLGQGEELVDTALFSPVSPGASVPPSGSPTEA